jgi:hypothetical protein
MTPENARNERGILPPPAGQPADLAASLEQFRRATRSVIDQAAVVHASLRGRLLTRGLRHRDFKIGPYGEIPAEWQLRSLGEVARFASGKRKPRDVVHAPSASHHIPVYGGKGLLGFGASTLRKGATIVVGRVGTHCGDVHFVPDEASWITDNALFVYENRPEADLRFLFHALSLMDLPSLSTRGRQPVISLSAIYPLPIALPPLAEQQEICEILSSLGAFREVQENVLIQAQRIGSLLPARFSPASVDNASGPLRKDQ